MSAPFKMKGFSGFGNESPLKQHPRYSLHKVWKTPKTDKVIGKALEHGANVATAGLYGQAKKYIKKQGGLAKTLDKHFPVGKKKK